MLRAWRIVKSRHVASAFSGDGARLYGGRWNTKGTPVVYTAGTPALAALEMLVHLDSHDLLQGYALIEAQFAKSHVIQLDPAELPADWNADPASPATREIGDSWIRNAKSAVLQVPSAVIDGEVNFLLNPAHRFFSQIQWGEPHPFRFDRRLVARQGD